MSDKIELTSEEIIGEMSYLLSKSIDFLNGSSNKLTDYYIRMTEVVDKSDVVLNDLKSLQEVITKRMDLTGAIAFADFIKDNKYVPISGSWLGGDNPEFLSTEKLYDKFLQTIES